MESGVFTGKFLKPAESFLVQHFNHLDLYRLGSEILLGIIVIVAVGLAVHFVVSTLPDLRRKQRGRE